MESEQNTERKVNLGTRVVGEIELPTIDISKYIGMKKKIAKVEEFEGTKFAGYYIKVSTELVDTLEVKDTDGQPLKLYATKIFGLQQNLDGQLGWGAKTKLGLYLSKMKAKHYKDLVNKEVVLQSVQAKNSGTEFLTFA